MWIALLAIASLAQEGVSRNPATAPDASRARIREQIELQYGAAQRDPSEPNLFELASTLASVEQYVEAEKFFRFGIERYPKSARLHIGLGVALHGQRQYDEAVQSLCAGVDIDPKDTRALYFLSKMYDVSPVLAEDVLKRLGQYVALYPQNPAAHLYYALSFWKSRNGRESEKDLAVVDQHLFRAIELDPTFPESHLQMGLLRERQNRNADAASAFREAVKQNPQFTTAWYRLGQALTRQGKSQEAEAAFRRYRELRASDK